MYLESVRYRHVIRWFTSLVGRKNDFEFFKAYLEKMTSEDLRVVDTQIAIGYTTRWVIAWTFV